MLGERLAREARDRAAPVADRPRGRREDAGERREQRRLPATRGTEEDHERAVGRVEVELVERPHDVVAGGVLDGEVGDDQVGCHHGPPNASAGSTFTARRRPARLESKPTTIAIANSNRYALVGISTGSGKNGASRVAMIGREHRGGDREDHRLHRKAASERGVRRARGLEHREVTRPLHRGEVHDRADDARRDDPQQHLHEVDRLRRVLQGAEQVVARFRHRHHASAR